MKSWRFVVDVKINYKITMSACQWPDQETNFDLSVESHFINEPSDNSGLRENIHVIRMVQVHLSYRGNNEAPSWYDDAWSEMICGSDDDIASWHWSWSWYVRNHQQLYNTHIWSMVSTRLTLTGLAAFKFNIKYKSVGFQCLLLSHYQQFFVLPPHVLNCLII